MTKRIELQVFPVGNTIVAPRSMWGCGPAMPPPPRIEGRFATNTYAAEAISDLMFKASIDPTHGPKFTLVIDVPDERTCSDCVAWHKFSQHRNGWCTKSVSCREKRPDETCEKWEAANRGLAVKI